MISPIGSKTPLNNVLKGFTLIELVLVVLLVSVLIGLSTPLFKNTFQQLQLKDASFNIVKIVNYAQERAIVEKTNYMLNFDFKKGTYWLSRLDSSGDMPLYIRAGGKFGRNFFLPDGISASGTASRITFYPDGRAGKADIKIKNRNGRGCIIHVKGFGRRVESEEIENN